MSDRPSGAIGIRILAVILAAVAAAGLWLVAASALWSKGTGTPFTPLAWWDATQWWQANWWVNLWLVLAAAAPTIVPGDAAVRAVPGLAPALIAAGAG